MTYSHLIHLIDQFPSAKILCVGDVMMDRFIYGSVGRISPEAPVPVLLREREESMLGGAGNVLRNIVELGSAGAFISVIGDDDVGRTLLKILSDLDGIDIDVLIEPRRVTTVKKRFVAGAHQLLRVDQEITHAISAEIEQELQDRFKNSLNSANVVVLSDYKKGVLTTSLLKNLIAMARAAGKKIIIDPKNANYNLYHGADVVTPNMAELAEAYGQPIHNEDEMIKAARSLIKTHSIGQVVVTRSGQGISLITADEHHHYPAEAREVFDVSGAGDTVVATIAVGLSAGLELKEAVELSNVAAGIVVGKRGTATVTCDEIREALRMKDRTIGHDKILTQQRLPQVLDNLRRQGKKIGFTNGCFDLIHPGHISLLRQAKAPCNILVVGLNSDESVARLKGPERPVQNETARADVLASMEAVDFVVIFEEDTPQNLIELVKPDVLVKGKDYEVSQVVGADFVTSYGGQVLLADLISGQSTTSIISRMNDKNS